MAARPRKRSDKDSLIADLGRAIRQVSAQSVILSQAVADRFGLHKTDLEQLDLISLRGGACFPGELSQAIGLTSGATTALIDRLERAGYVVRERDSADRRRQFIRIRPEAMKAIEAAYAPMQAAMFKLWSDFNAQDLAVVLDFLDRSSTVAQAHVEKVRKPAS